MNEGGVAGLFRGAGARVCFFAPATTITMSCYETCRNFVLCGQDTQIYHFWERPRMTSVVTPRTSKRQPGGACHDVSGDHPGLMSTSQSVA